MKRCCTCKKEKPFTEYTKSKGKKDGLERRCKSCCKEYRDKNKERTKEYNKKYRIENLDKLKRYEKEYRILHPEVRMSYEARNKERIKKNKSEYNKTNRDLINKQKREHRNKNENYRIASNIHCRLWHAVKHGRNSDYVEQLIGCTVQEYKLHIESLWMVGMSWENYKSDGWHIDHIKPCAAFDLTKESERKECYNYRNTQPLWALDNISKNSKYDGKYYIIRDGEHYAS